MVEWKKGRFLQQEQIWKAVKQYVYFGKCKFCII